MLDELKKLIQMISSVHFDNKEKYIFLILGKGPTQGLDTTLTTEISIQF